MIARWVEFRRKAIAGFADDLAARVTAAKEDALCAFYTTIQDRCVSSKETAAANADCDQMERAFNEAIAFIQAHQSQS